MQTSPNKIYLLIAFILPLLAGALGCANRTRSFSVENIEWALGLSLPISMTSLASTGILFCLSSKNKLREETFRGLLIITIMLPTLISFQFSDSASGA